MDRCRFHNTHIDVSSGNLDSVNIMTDHVCTRSLPASVFLVFTRLFVHYFLQYCDTVDWTRSVNTMSIKQKTTTPLGFLQCFDTIGLVAGQTSGSFAGTSITDYLLTQLLNHVEMVWCAGTSFRALRLRCFLNTMTKCGSVGSHQMAASWRPAQRTEPFVSGMSIL